MEIAEKEKNGKKSFYAFTGLELCLEVNHNEPIGPPREQSAWLQ